MWHLMPVVRPVPIRPLPAPLPTTSMWRCCRYHDINVELMSLRGSDICDSTGLWCGCGRWEQEPALFEA